MRRPEDASPERILLLCLAATLLFVGGLRVFFTAIYYQNLTELGLNATALYSLALLAPFLFLVRPVRERPRAVLLAGALGLAIGRSLLAPTRGTPLQLPLAAVATASALLLLGALVTMLRRENAPIAGAGIAIGWAIDIALRAYEDSADPTATMRGLLLLLPTAAFLVLLSAQVAREHRPGGPSARAPYTEEGGSGWVAGAALGAWLFLEGTILANPYGAARWNGADPAPFVVASVAGLLAGSLLALRRSIPRAPMLALHAALALALLDHALLHSRALPILILLAQATMAIDAGLLLRALARPRGAIALGLAGFVALLLHFAYAFTFTFAYVPLTPLWKGHEEALILLAAIVLLAPLARRALERPPHVRHALTLLAIPALVAGLALATPGASVPEPRDATTFRVMTFNVHQGFANDGALDPGVFVALLDGEDADIVVLQEADTPRFTSGDLDTVGHLAAKAGYHFAYGQPTRAQAFGGAILSRFPIEEWQAIQLPSDSDNRYYTEARLDVRGTDVWLYAVHFTLPRDSRVVERDALLAQALTRTGPTIIAGDLNSCPPTVCPDEERGTEPDDVYATLAARYQDPWVALGHDANDTEAYTFEATDPDQRIDYILISREIEAIAYERVRTDTAIRASDHMPVRADLRLRG